LLADAAIAPVKGSNHHDDHHGDDASPAAP
jgi:hypothetical protein